MTPLSRRERSEDSDYYDHYIRIPSDLFGERCNRQAPAVLLPTPYNGRTAGVYPPPRPLSHPGQPWTLQGRRAGATQNDSHRSVRKHCSHRFSDQRDTTQNSGSSDDLRRQCHLYYQHFRQRRGGSSHHEQLMKHQCSLSDPLFSDSSTRCMWTEENCDQKKSVPRNLKGHHCLENILSLSSGTEKTFQDGRCRRSALPPVLHTSPCAIHLRHSKTPHRDLDLLYSTNCHGGKVKALRELHTANRHLCLGKDNSLQQCLYNRHDFRSVKVRGQDERSGLRPRGWDEELDSDRTREVILRAQQQQQYQQKLFHAQLPEALGSKDVVLSWLKYGSAPPGESHFPHIRGTGHRVKAGPHASPVI